MDKMKGFELLYEIYIKKTGKKTRFLIHNSKEIDQSELIYYLIGFLNALINNKTKWIDTDNSRKK
jgi:hypothetical protein